MSTSTLISETGRKQLETVINVLLNYIQRLHIERICVNRMSTGWDIYIDVVHRDVVVLKNIVCEILKNTEPVFWQLKYKDVNVDEPYNYFDIGISPKEIFEAVSPWIYDTLKPDMYLRFKIENIVIKLTNYPWKNINVTYSNGLKILLQYIPKIIDKVSYITVLYYSDTNMYKIDIKLGELCDILKQIAEEYKKCGLYVDASRIDNIEIIGMSVRNLPYELVEVEYKCPKCGFTIRGVTTHPEVFRFPICPICGMADFDDTYEGDEQDNVDDYDDCDDC